MLSNSGAGKTLKSSLDSREIKPVNSKENQPWIFIGKTDAEAAIFWPPDVKNWLIWKDLDAWKVWGQEEKGVTEDEMVGRHHRLSGHEFEQTPGDSEGQESLVCCSPWGPKESDMTVTEQPPQTHPIELPWELNETIRTEYLSQYPYRVSFQNTSCF